MYILILYTMSQVLKCIACTFLNNIIPSKMYILPINIHLALRNILFLCIFYVPIIYIHSKTQS